MGLKKKKKKNQNSLSCLNNNNLLEHCVREEYWDNENKKGKLSMLGYSFVF